MSRSLCLSSACKMLLLSSSHKKISWSTGSPCRAQIWIRERREMYVHANCRSKGPRHIIQAETNNISSDRKSYTDLHILVLSFHAVHTPMQFASKVIVIVVHFVLILQLLLPTQIHVFLDCPYAPPRIHHDHAKSRKQNLLVL